MRLFIYPEESKALVSNEIHIVAKDVVEDLAHLHFMDGEAEISSLESPTVAEKLGEANQSCSVESKSGNKDTFLRLFKALMISGAVVHLFLGIILILALIAWPPIPFPKSFISYPSNFDRTKLLEYYIGIASTALGCSGILAFLASAPLARLVNKCLSGKDEHSPSGIKGAVMAHSKL